MNISIPLMLLSVVLWMLYPPIVNELVDENGVFFVAAIAHTSAAVCTLLCVGLLFGMDKKVQYLEFFRLGSLKKLALPVISSGILICTNHLLLYQALQITGKFDVVATLVFETWPVLFFVIDSFLRRKKGSLRGTDYLYTMLAFVGFAVLMVPAFDFSQENILNEQFMKVFALALAGGCAMAVNCYCRMKTMDVFTTLADEKGYAVSDLKRGILTEGCVRLMAAPLFILVAGFFVPGTHHLAEVSTVDLSWMVFTGVAILAFGSLLYDLAIFKASNAAVTVFWYLVPVGAVLLLAYQQGRFLTFTELVACLLIVIANLLISFRKPSPEVVEA